MDSQLPHQHHYLWHQSHSLKSIPHVSRHIMPFPEESNPTFGCPGDISDFLLIHIFLPTDFPILSPEPIGILYGNAQSK